MRNLDEDDQNRCLAHDLDKLLKRVDAFRQACLVRPSCCSPLRAFTL
jgi:hypothetical protein